MDSEIGSGPTPSRLRGSLAPKHDGEPDPSIGSTPSRLRGSLVPKHDGEPAPSMPSDSARLESDSAGATSDDELTVTRSELNPTIIVGVKVIQRDTGDVYSVESIIDTPRGRHVILRGPMNQTANLKFEDLLRKLNTENSPWRYMR